MKLVIANPVDRTSIGYSVIQDAWQLAKRELRLDRFPDKRVILMLDGQAGDTAMARATFQQSAVLGATDQGFDDDGFIRVMVARISNARLMMHSFLHELVHVEQTASGRSIQLDDGTMIYEGKEYPNVVPKGMASFGQIADQIDAKKTDYENAPWETEARAKSDKLIEIMDKHMKRRGLIE